MRGTMARRHEGTKWVEAAIVAAVFLLPLALMGCGQQAAQVQDQPTAQPQTTETRQQAAAQGNIYVTVQNAPDGKGGAVLKPTAGGGEEGDALGDWINAASTSGPGGNTSGGQRATFAMAGTTINVTTGGTSPALTGTATGGAMTQTPTNAGTQTPTQHIQPETSAAVPIAVALPGGNNSQQAAATGRGTTSDVSKQDTIEQQYAEIRAQAAKIKELTEALEALKASRPGAATQPTGP